MNLKAIKPNLCDVKRKDRPSTSTAQKLDHKFEKSNI